MDEGKDQKWIQSSTKKSRYRPINFPFELPRKYMDLCALKHVCQKHAAQIDALIKVKIWLPCFCFKRRISA